MKICSALVSGLTLLLSISTSILQAQSTLVLQPAAISDEIVSLVEENYWRAISRDSIKQMLNTGGLESLDPYSTSLDSIAWSEFQSNLAGQFSGIGVFLDENVGPDGYRVKGVFVNSPALQAGMRPNDIILTVDKKPLRDLAIDEVLGLLRGVDGSTVRLEVKRDSLDNLRNFEMQRAVISTPSVRGAGRAIQANWTYCVDEKSHIAYLRVMRFTKTTSNEVEAALARINESSSKALILDLRGNEGGLFKSAIEIADDFLDTGLIVTVKGRSADNDIKRATQGARWVGPIVVLIDKSTASSAEVLAASLRDHRRAVIIGERSFGKGSVQKLFPLQDNISGIKLTIAMYLPPSGQSLERRLRPSDSSTGGVWPDQGWTSNCSLDQMSKATDDLLAVDEKSEFAFESIPTLSPELDCLIASACSILLTQIAR